MTAAFGAWLLSAVLVAQAPARDGATAGLAGTASIAGVISTDAQPSRPLRRVMVTLTAADNGQSRATVTDDAGKFLFSRLPAGRYSLNASRPGWIGMFYGARRPGRPGTSIPIEDGQRATIAMRLPRTAVVTGTVLDSNGQPMAGLTVRAVRYSIVNGERRLVPTGVTSGPDERGVYRLYSLAPGEYYISASGRSSPFMDGRELHLTTDVDVQQATQAIQQGTAQPGGPAAAVDAAPERHVAFAPAYYPGTAAPAQATLLTLRAGEERGGVDFALPLVPTVRVEGTVAGADGTVPPATQVNLLTNDLPASGIAFDGYRTTRVGTDGKFQFADVAPGVYTLAARVALPPPPGTARGNTSAPILWATTEASVAGESVSGLSLMLQPGLTASGTIRFDGAGAPPADLSTARVSLLPVITGNQVSISSTGATVDASGRFTIGGLSPGRYRLNAALVNARGWTYRSTLVGGQDTLDRPIDVRASMEDIVVTFTDRTTQLDGKVQNASGAAAPDCQVILFATDSTAWHAQSRRIQSVRPATDGAYSIKNVAPGEYLLVAIDDVEPGEWFDPIFLQRASAGAMKVTIGEGEKKIQDIRVGG